MLNLESKVVSSRMSSIMYEYAKPRQQARFRSNHSFSVQPSFMLKRAAFLHFLLAENFSYSFSFHLPFDFRI